MGIGQALIGLVVGGALALAGAPAALAQQPLSVTYGLDAPSAEGDPDFREVIFLSVPETLGERLYLRVFDPDTGGEHDMMYGGAEDTETRFALFGGAGALTGVPPVVPAAAEAPTGAAAVVAGAKEEARSAGELIAERRYGPNPVADGRWQTLASFLPSDGELVDGRRVFRLLVEGLTGNDANLYTVTLSLRDRRNLVPDDLAIFSYLPTLRVPDGRSITELRFDVPPDAAKLRVGNFDLANGEVALTTTFRSVPLPASGQDAWQTGEVALLEDERGGEAALTFGGGAEIPNDATFFVADENGRPLVIRLPARAWLPNARPEPVAEAMPLASCFAVAFDASASSDADGDDLQYFWAFGDGTTGVGPAPIHTYDGPGTYQATLRVVDSSGQVGSGAVLDFDVFVKRPPTAAAGPDRLVAVGERVTFDGGGSRPGDRPIARYVWDFNDGTGTEGSAVDHRFARPGRYAVTLRVEDDAGPPCNVATDRLLVTVNAPPTARAGVDRRAAVDEVLTFDGARSTDVDGEITSWHWDFGDGESAEGPVVEHVFAAPGTYEVRLTVSDDAGVANSTDSDSLLVRVNAPPVAEAGPDRLVAIGEVVRFDGSASIDPDGAIIDHVWDFGDGATGRGERVEYAYRSPGTYRVTLRVRDDSATATDSASDSLTVVVNDPPVADAGPAQVVTSSEVRFDGSGSHDPDGRIARYEWDFGDGATGAGVSPVHVYRQAGEYDVVLTVTDDSGTLRSSASDRTSVLINEAPIADAGPDLIGAPGQELRFAGTGSLDPDGDLAAFLWDFKDGTTIAGAQVAHRFEKPGIYLVRLEVQDDTGHPGAVDFDEAKVVINAPPVADAGQDLLAAPGDAVRFDGTGSFDVDGTLVSHRWDFSDLDEPMTGAEVMRAYAAPGVYSARLTVTDDSGAINATAEDEVTVRINHAPVADAGSDIVTAETTVTFDGTGSTDADGDPLTYGWDFGDGTPPAAGARVTHTYAEGGVYPVVLSVDDGTGLWNARHSAAITVEIDRAPIAVAGDNRAVCAGDIVVLDGSASEDPEGGLLRYSWDLGDGSRSGIVNPTKTYERGGVYPVTLTVEDDSGFSGNRHTDRIVVRVDESPIAEAGPDQQVCAGTEVHFDGSSSRDSDGVVNRYSWNFGDGSTGGGDRPVHVYKEAGTYRVVLTIEGDDAGQCSSTDSDEMVVRVVEAPVARIDAPDAWPVGEPVTFDARGSAAAEGEIVAWRWDFGDGQTADGPVVEHVFETADAYLVTLEIETDQTATPCAAVTAQHPIDINAPPVAVAASDRLVGVDQEVVFDAAASFDADGAITSYRWDFGDGTSASGMVARKRFRESGSFPVTLTVTDDAGLANSTAATTMTVEVNAAPEPVIAAPDGACAGEPVTFSSHGSRDADNGITAFAWDFGDGTKASGAEARHDYRAPGQYHVALTVDDGRDLNNSRRTAAIAFPVNRPPVARAGPDRLTCPGDPVAFDGLGSVDLDGEIVAWQWDFGDGTSAGGPVVEHAYEAPGTYAARLRVQDDSGTSCAVAEDVARVVVNTPPVADAGPDREGHVGGAHDEILFDAAGSVDADGQPLAIFWQMGDGVTRIGEKVLHAYGEPGVYTVRLRVDDGTGLACGRAEEEITVVVRERGASAAVEAAPGTTTAAR